MENILLNGIYNDLGFLVKNRLIVLVEAQSTWSPNIIIRGLIYLMSTYQEYFNSKSVNLYGSTPVKMPKPELYVIYTKKKGSHPDILSFQQEFFPNTKCCIDAEARIIYEDDSNTIINQYIKFCMILDQQVKNYGRTIKAIKETIRICKDRNLMKQYLESRETGVEDIMITLFDQERMTQIYGEECKEKGRISMLYELVKDGVLSLAEAAKRAGMSEESFRKINML